MHAQYSYQYYTYSMLPVGGMHIINYYKDSLNQWNGTLQEENFHSRSSSNPNNTQASKHLLVDLFYLFHLTENNIML